MSSSTASTSSPLDDILATTAAAPRELDIAFCCDCTGSMGQYIKSAQDNIRSISASIHDRCKENTSVRFSLVKYRDHPPQDSTFITEVFDFTENVELMKRNVDTMTASGGGDGPEAVAAALHEVNTLAWRPNATKVVVMISDAPPHGLGENGDGFPQGCPQGHDPVKIVKEMAAKNITIYAVGVEPVLSTSYKFARDFMMMLATATDGKFLPLGKASILSDVVVNGAVEGLNMKHLWERLEAEVEQEAKANGKKLNTDDLVAATEARLAEQAKHVTMAQVDVANPYMDNYDEFNCNRMMAASSLAEARSKMDSHRNAHVAQASAGYAWGSQAASCAPQPMQQQQQQRMVAHAKKGKGAYSWGSS